MRAAAPNTTWIPGPVWEQTFSYRAKQYCQTMFRNMGSKWDVVYARWQAGYGGAIPDADRNSWADSCPTYPVRPPRLGWAQQLLEPGWGALLVFGF